MRDASSQDVGRTTEQLPNEFLVRAWMSSPDYSVSEDDTVEDALRLLKRERIRHLLVLDEEDELVGVVTDRDLRRPDGEGGQLLSVADMYFLGEDMKVRDVMSLDPVTIGPDATIAEAARLMVENKFDCLPVVDDGELCGIVTSSDLLRALVRETDPLTMEQRQADVL